MDILLLLAPAALAAGAIVDLWFASSLFAPLRRLLQAKSRRWALRDIPPPLSDAPPPWGRFLGFLDRLIPDALAERPLLCPHCLSVWAAGLCTLCCAAWLIARGQWAELWLLPLHWLGGFRLSWLINLRLPAEHRYPAPEEEDPDDDPPRTDGGAADESAA